MSQGQGPQIEIQRIYVKDISYEAPNVPHLFLGEWEPQLNLDIDIAANQLDQALFEVELTLTATVKVKDKVAFIVQVKQAGIFLLKEFSQEDLQQVFGVACPTILYPFAREVVSDLTTKGGFPSLLLAPVNFQTRFLQQQQEGMTKQ